MADAILRRVQVPIAVQGQGADVGARHTEAVLSALVAGKEGSGATKARLPCVRDASWRWRCAATKLAGPGTAGGSAALGEASHGAASLQRAGTPGEGCNVVDGGSSPGRLGTASSDSRRRGAESLVARRRLQPQSLPPLRCGMATHTRCRLERSSSAGMPVCCAAGVSVEAASSAAGEAHLRLAC